MQIPVQITLWFGDGPMPQADIRDSKDVPWSIIIESLQMLAKGMAAKLVEDAHEDVEPEEVDDYLQGMINLDREKLKILLKYD